jgi:hypothetical protein
MIKQGASERERNDNKVIKLNPILNKLNKIKIDDFKMSTLFRNKQFLDLILSDKK